MASDPKYSDNQGRVQHQTYIDSVIEKWTETLDANDVKRHVDECGVPNGLIYSIKDICEDPQYIARGQLESVHIPQLNKELLIPAIGPKLSATPGQTRFPGHQIGEDTDAVLMEMLKMSEEQLVELKKQKILA